MNVLDLHRLCEPLAETLPDVEILGPDVTVRGLCGDSRRVVPGDLFFASVGTKEDGARYAQQAIAGGAVAVVGASRPDLTEAVPFVGVPDVDRAKAILADRFYDSPSRRLQVVGITGTNGKTTTAFMLRSILTMNGVEAGLIGTLGAYLRGRHEELVHTTPDAIELNRLLARMVDENLDTVVMEVSSHGLVQRRVHGIEFDVAVFTNLSSEHLDYHHDMDRYAAAKGMLFESLGPEATAVLNAADPASRVYRLSTEAQVLRYGVETDAEVRGDVTRLDADGAAFRLRAPAHGLDMAVPLRLVGRHNVANALAAAAAALALHQPASAIGTGLGALSAVPGRLEPIECGQDFRVLVDYAHTPDALEQVLELLRPLTRGRLCVVFGCGGDRDRSKRPLMGRAVASLADTLVVTSDNPRGEQPEAILADILEGIPAEARAQTEVLVDRREAIERACREARGGDIVLLAGKGHETTQTIGQQVLPFDDRAVARDVLWSL